VSILQILGGVLKSCRVLKNGTPIYDDCNAKLGYSKKAAQAGISDAVLYNILYAVPPMGGYTSE
jgi:hypothetical protein